MIVDDDPFMTFNGAFLISQDSTGGTVIMPPVMIAGTNSFCRAIPPLPGTIIATRQARCRQSLTQWPKASVSRARLRIRARPGQGVSATDKANVASRLAQLTGIPKDEWIRANLRIDPDAFRRLLLRDQGLRIGRFDARYSIGNSQVFDAGERYDPSLQPPRFPI